MDSLDPYLREHAADFEEELMAFLRIPSISAQSEHRQDVRQAAEFVAGRLDDLGLNVEVVETAGHPLVLADSTAEPGMPTALVYGHYDVQPPEPLDQWINGPFEPTVRDGNVYARGASDDKGQLLTHIKAAEAWIRTEGKLPIRLKFLIEGEEETGSQNLARFVHDNKDRLRCDWVVISDTPMFAPELPSICYALRGIAYFEITVEGPKQDLHSGRFGGIVVNPANVLADLLASLTDDRGKIRLPGFYDAVVPLEREEKAEMARLPFSKDAVAELIGVEPSAREEGYSLLECQWARPTCDICGIYGGYQAEGSKTIIPARAGAKVSFRLVPDQDPEAVAQSFETYLRQQMPPGAKLTVRAYQHGYPVRVSPRSPGVQAAKRALQRGFGREPVLIRHGGSIPVVSTFQKELGVDSLLIGFGLPDDQPHSPNEKMSLANFHNGIRTSAFLWHELAGAVSSSRDAPGT